MIQQALGPLVFDELGSLREDARDADARQAAIKRVRDCVLDLHGTDVEVIDSPIQGMEGNHEYLLHTTFTNT